MWLPKEERYLLMFYTACDPNFDQSEMTFEIEDLKRVLSKKIRPSQVVKFASELRERKNGARRRDNDVENTQAGGNNKSVMTQNVDNVDGVKKYMSWLRAKVTIESVNNRLKERGLIESRECGTGFYQVKMNLAGWDLGNKYNSRWSRNVLWFREYKDHWIWLIVSFFGGVIGALLINWLSSLFTNSAGAQ
ncbi:MAG: hypothetical protein ABIF19_03765 [Planctomycetota bacterium]